MDEALASQGFESPYLQTSPRRLMLPTSLHRLRLRKAASGRPGGYVWQAKLR
jgi:hypothetical protein